MLSNMIKNNTDFLMVLETKLHSSFPQSLFITEGYALPFRYDERSHVGCITAQKMMFSIKDFFCKCEKSAASCAVHYPFCKRRYIC